MLERRPDLTQERLAQALRVTRYSVNQLVNDRRAITAEMALRLSQATSTTPEFWLNLQRDVDLRNARRKLRQGLEQVEVLFEPVPLDDLFYDIED
jgi:addiction module HigA family antidote